MVPPTCSDSGRKNASGRSLASGGLLVSGGSLASGRSLARPVGRSHLGRVTRDGARPYGVSAVAVNTATPDATMDVTSTV